MTFSLDEIMMREALKQAHAAAEADEVPVGAIIAYEGTLIAKAHNQVEMLKDPTAHAEMIAITQATNTLKTKWLYDCTMYVTLEPCSMCAGALVLARCSRVVFGAFDSKTGACGSLFNITQSPQLNHQMDVVGGILELECSQILKDFFLKKRVEQKICLTDE